MIIYDNLGYCLCLHYIINIGIRRIFNVGDFKLLMKK
jgi:hypothetical protein